MLRDDVAIQASLQTLAEVASLREYRDELRRKNQAAAERSLKRYEECERAQREVLEAQQELHALASDYAAKLEAKKRLVLTEREVLARAEAHCRALDASSMCVRERLFAGAVSPEGLRNFLQVHLLFTRPPPPPSTHIPLIFSPAPPPPPPGIPASADRLLRSQGQA